MVNGTSGTEQPPWRNKSLVVVVVAAIFLLIGIVLFIGGIWLAVVGGSLYYLLAGLGLIGTGALVLRGQRLALRFTCLSIFAR